MCTKDSSKSYESMFLCSGKMYKKVKVNFNFNFNRDFRAALKKIITKKRKSLLHIAHLIYGRKNKTFITLCKKYNETV